MTEAELIEAIETRLDAQRGPVAMLHARLALTAIRAAGCVVVPEVPTDAMEIAPYKAGATDPAERWEAMLAASPMPPEVTP